MTDDKLRAALDAVIAEAWANRSSGMGTVSDVTIEWMFKLRDAALAASATDEGHDWRDHSSSPHHHADGDSEPTWARPAVPALDAQALRLALRTEMGWSVHEVEEFLTEYGLTKPLDEYDPQRIDGEYAALRSKEPPPSQDTAQLDWRDSR